MSAPAPQRPPVWATALGFAVIYITWGTTYFAIGNSWVLATIVANGCAMFTILFVLLRAGRDFYDSPAVGGLAFFCFCNINAVLGWSGYYQTDLPMTAAEGDPAVCPEPGQAGVCLRARRLFSPRSIARICA